MNRNIKKTCQFNVKIFYPDHATPNLWSSDELKNFEFDEGKFSCFNGENMAVTLSEDGKEFRIKSMTNLHSIVDITFTRVGGGFVVGENGTTYYGTDLANPWGSMRHAFWPRATVKGTVVTKNGPIDCAGRGMLSHALQGMKPHHAGKKGPVSVVQPAFIFASPLTSHSFAQK
jgi:hypothetical protein